KLAKCHFDYPEIEFLGHCIDKNGRYPSKKAVAAIVELGYPCEDQTSVRSFVGMTLYYKDYIRGYSDIVSPLHGLTRKGVDVKARWGEEHRDAVDRLKKALTEAPCLQTVDNTKPFQIRVDACRKGRGLGAVLLQPSVHDETKWVPVAYWSKGLRPAEREYSPTELECKGLHDCILHWDVYLQCAKVFDVYTDHNALQYMVRGQTATNNGRLMRYLMDLQGYTFNLHYKEGRYHLDADGVSRLLRKGETPVYWTADDLEDDKGVPTEEDLLWARDQDARKNRRKEAMMHRKMKHSESEQLDIIDKILQSPDNADEVVEEDRKMKKEIKQQKKLLETLIEQKDKLASLGIGPDIPAEEFVQNCAHCAVQVGGKRQGNESQTETLGWVQRLRGRGKAVQYEVEARPQAWRDDVDTAPKTESEVSLESKKRAGYSRLRVLPSSIKGAGEGLFSRYLIKDRGYICDYAGREINIGELDSKGYDTTYVFSALRDGKWIHVD
ncbi:MAG: Ty3/Gypsy family RNase HI domain-containing protein, partial [Bdellovibrionales bacterium]